MGIGPVMAIPKVLGKLGLRVEDVDVFEINEAFASMVGGWLLERYVAGRLAD